MIRSFLSQRKHFLRGNLSLLQVHHHSSVLQVPLLSISHSQRRCLSFTTGTKEVPRYQRTSLASPKEKTTDLINRLESHLKSQAFRKFEEDLKLLGQLAKYRNALSFGQKKTLFAMMNDWNTFEHGIRRRVNILRSLNHLELSVLKSREEKQVLDSLVSTCLTQSEGVMSGSLFSGLINTLKHSQYRWNNNMDRTMQTQLMTLLENLQMDEELTAREFSGIISALTGLGMNWKSLSEPAQNNILSIFISMEPKLETSYLVSIIYNFGKLGVKLKEIVEVVFLRLVIKGLNSLVVDDSKDKGREVNTLNPFLFLV
jgi:hypothetical protein